MEALGTRLHRQDAEQSTGAWAVHFQLQQPGGPALATDREKQTLPGSPPRMGLRGPASWGVADGPRLDLGRLGLDLCKSKCSQVFVLFSTLLFMWSAFV